MIERITAFFTAGRERRDQAYAEASIELLLLAMYADGELSPAERQVLEDASAGLPWHGTTPKALFIQAAYGRVRDAHVAKQRKAFILSVAERVPKTDDRMHLLVACGTLLKSDGVVLPAEKEFLNDVRAGFALT